VTAGIAPINQSSPGIGKNSRSTFPKKGNGGNNDIGQSFGFSRFHRSHVRACAWLWFHFPWEEYHMRRTLALAMIATSMALTACSEKTQDAAETTAASASEDAANAAAAAGEAAKETATAAANAADKAAAATDELGDKAENARAKAEASLHNESTAEAKRD